jgi:murein DD-endopeptidase MepM/ murein hydrolase activator NlpD
VKHAIAGLVLLLTGLLLAAQPAVATTATPSPSPATPSPSPATSPHPSPSPLLGPSPSPSPTLDPNKALFDQLATRLRGDLATALADQQRLNTALDQGRIREQKLSDQVDAEANKVSDLEDEVAQLDDQVSTTQDEVDRERAQVGGLARSLYRRPSNWLVLLAGAKDVHQALLQGADTIIAGRRAHALQLRLESDLAKLKAARAQRQQDLDQERALKASLEADLNRLDDQLNVQDDIANQLLDLTDQMQTALPDLRSQSPADATKLIQLLEAEQRSLAAAEAQNAWSLAAVGSGRYESRGLLPTGQPVANLKLEWPMPGAAITQPVGPTDLVLEPPLGPYDHFHTGLDLAEPAGTPVTAAAAGLVVVASHGRIGYGNFVVIAHGQGVETLYGHLKSLEVAAGDQVRAGQVVGREGSSGFSTGPHLHFELRINGQPTDPMLYLPAPGYRSK